MCVFGEPRGAGTEGGESENAQNKEDGKAFLSIAESMCVRVVRMFENVVAPVFTF